MPDDRPTREDGELRESDETIRALVEADAVPNEDGDPVFTHPWQARSFGLAVAMRGADGPIDWRSFQGRLASEIETGESTTADPDAVEERYYRHWLAALERLVVAEGYLTEEQLRRRATEFAAGDRTAAEFVEGEHEH